MKLSDIEAIKKAAAEYERLLRTEKYLGVSGVFDINFCIRRMSTDNELKITFSQNSGMEMETFQNDLAAAFRKQRELMQTKLAMYGVTDFEQDKK